MILLVKKDFKLVAQAFTIVNYKEKSKLTQGKQKKIYNEEHKSIKPEIEKQQIKISGTKSWFLEKINKI